MARWTGGGRGRLRRALRRRRGGCARRCPERRGSGGFLGGGRRDGRRRRGGTLMRAMLSALVVLAVTGCSLNPQPLPPDAPDAAGAVTDNPGADGGKPSQKTDASFDNEGGAGGGSDGGDANEGDSD